MIWFMIMIMIMIMNYDYYYDYDYETTGKKKDRGDQKLESAKPLFKPKRISLICGLNFLVSKN